MNIYIFRLNWLWKVVTRWLPSSKADTIRWIKIYLSGYEYFLGALEFMTVHIIFSFAWVSGNKHSKTDETALFHKSSMGTILSIQYQSSVEITYECSTCPIHKSVSNERNERMVAWTRVRQLDSWRTQAHYYMYNSCFRFAFWKSLILFQFAWVEAISCYWSIWFQSSTKIALQVFLNNSTKYYYGASQTILPLSRCITM